MEPWYFDHNNSLSLAKCEGGGGVLGEVVPGPWDASNDEDFGYTICPTTEPQIGLENNSLRKRKGGKINASSETVKTSKTTPCQSTAESKDSERSDLSQKSGRKKKESSSKTSKTTDVQKSDYIHVRARRGEATDSHSLAERVRREKISQRMKCLQELVPGCNKLMGKVGMLDEIINYLQSLQRQVEFLSMKLAVSNPTITSDVYDLYTNKGLSVAFPNIPAEMFSSNQVQVEPINGMDEKRHLFTENFIDSHSFDHEATWGTELENLYNIHLDQQLDMRFNSHQFSGFLDNVDVKIEMSPFEDR